jgi:hypothetical protein
MECGRRRCRCGSLWFGGVYGLGMTRDDENSYFFSYNDADEADQRTNGRDANFEWAGGFDVRFGRYFNCHCNGLEAVYWAVYPGRGYTMTTTADVSGNLNGILNWDSLTYNGLTADNFVNNAQAHAVFRENEFHNVEMNLLHFCGYGLHGPYGGSPLQYRSLAGLRFFKFRDDLIFGADTVNNSFTGAADEIYYSISTDNNLIGVQLGGEAEYRVTRCLAMDFGIKCGLFGNHIRHSSVIGGAAGDAFINNGPNAGRSFVVQNHKNDTAFLGELNAGLEYRPAPRWTTTIG